MRKRASATSVLLASILVVGCGESSTSTPDAAPAGTPPDTWVLGEVVDGDTVELIGSDGEPETVRIIGINAPESDECFAEEAAEALRSLLEDVAVTLVSDVTDRDRFGRALRYVETASSDGAVVDVGARMVGAGVARAYRYEPDVARADEYERLQDEARASEDGLWAPDACGPAAVDRDSIELEVEFNFDPPGDESQDLNAEWVRITNAGDVDLDLAGWTIADATASNRHHIVRLVLPSGGAVTVHSGCGSNTSTERFWCSSRNAIWNNGGDTLTLYDEHGNVVHTESYTG